MSRAEHTYTAGDVTVHLIVPDGIGVPPTITLKREADGAFGTFTHAGVRNLRAAAARKPRVENATAIPADWTPPAEEFERLRAECGSVNFAFELDQMRDHYIGKGQRMKDWVAVWRRWVRETHKRNVERGWKPARVAEAPAEDPLAQWCRERGITVDEWREKKSDPVWVEKIKRRGIIQ